MTAVRARVRTWSIAALAIVVLASSARADGLDVFQWVARVPHGESGWATLALVVAILTINYVLNFAVIGLPARRWSTVGTRRIALDLIALTLLGQIADRVGAFAALIVAGLFDAFVMKDGNDGFLSALIVCNFLCTGLAVGLLVRAFVRTKWDIAPRRAWMLALAAGVLTNPTFGLLALGYLYG